MLSNQGGQVRQRGPRHRADGAEQECGPLAHVGDVTLQSHPERLDRPRPDG